MNLIDGPKLVPAAATAALIVTTDKRYLLQHRDDVAGIFFPGYWGCFGGGIEGDETPEECMRRELEEELSFAPSKMASFVTLELDFSFANRGKIPRHFFEIVIDQREVDDMILGEGQGMNLFEGAEVMRHAAIIPYDATVIWQHLTRHRF